MSRHFGDRLHEAILRTGTCACVGIDPRPADFHPSLRPGDGARAGEVADAIRSWGTEILAAVEGEVPIVKLQSACFEAWGVEGVAAFADLCRAAQARGLLVIADAKRGDIGSSADLYARAFLADDSPFACDALTINPYLGEESLEPFFAAAEGSGRGTFVVCKTSNPGSAELQDLTDEAGATVFERIAARVERRGSGQVGAHGYSSAGLVVGATYPEQGVRVRRQAPHTFFLVPGYGHQGGKAEDLSGLRGADGGGIIVSSSRGITEAWKRTPDAEFGDAVRAAVAAMKADLASLLPAGASSGSG